MNCIKLYKRYIIVKLYVGCCVSLNKRPPSPYNALRQNVSLLHNTVSYMLLCPLYTFLKAIISSNKANVTFSS